MKKYDAKALGYLKKYQHFPKVEDERIRIPNQELQKILPVVIESVKQYYRQTYKKDYLIELSGINLIADSTAEEIKEYDDDVENFFSFVTDGLGLYTLFYENGYLQNPSPSDQSFLESIKNIRTICELTEEDKRKQEEITKDLLKDTSKMHFN